jgi:hypothetical protein
MLKMRKIFVYFFMVYWLFSSSLVVKKTILVDMEWMLVTPVTLGQPTGWVFWSFGMGLSTFTS